IVDSTKMNAIALDGFVREQIAQAKAAGVICYAHLEATVMKVSDPILFGQVVEAFFPEAVAEYGDVIAEAGVTSDNGLAAILAGLDTLPAAAASGIRAGIEKGLAEGPDLAMVNSHKGITNLHVPSDVIVDASMPAMIRVGGKMWNKDDQKQDTLA